MSGTMAEQFGRDRVLVGERVITPQLAAGLADAADSLPASADKPRPGVRRVPHVERSATALPHGLRRAEAE